MRSECQASRSPSREGLRNGSRVVWLLILLAVVPYLNAIQNELVYDDLALVRENRRIWSLHPAPIFLEPGLERYVVEWYRPLTLYSFALNYAVHGLAPAGYHLVNIGLHLANTLLLYGLAGRMRAAPVGAFIAAALFAVHPVHVEAVVPASGRADLLSAFFVLLAWRLSLGGSHRSEKWRGVAIGSAAAAALLAKESAIVLWPLLAVSDLLGLGQPGNDRRASLSRLTTRASLHVAIALGLIGYFALRVTATGGWLAVPGATIRALENPLAEADIPVRLATAVWVLVKYFGLLLFPLTLSADYSFNQIPLISGLGDPRLWIAVAFAGAVGAVLRLGWRRNFLFTASLLLLFLTWLPLSNTVLVIGTIMAERLMYLPSTMFALAAGALVESGWPRRPSRSWKRIALLVAVLGIFLGRTVVRNRDWQSSETLFSKTVRTAPQSAKARFNYGTVLLGQGQLTRAAQEFEEAVRIAGWYPEARNALGTVFLQQQELDRAEALFRQAIEEQPDLGSAWANLGAALFRAGKDEEAEGALERAATLRPDLPLVWATLGAIAERRGQVERAIERLQRAYQLSPSMEGLGEHLQELLARTGRLAEAQAIARERAERQQRPD